MKSRKVQEKIARIDILSKQLQSEKNTAAREKIHEKISDLFSDLEKTIANAERDSQKQLRAEVEKARNQFAALDKQFAEVDAMQDVFLKGTDQINRNNPQEVDELLAYCLDEINLEKERKKDHTADTTVKPLKITSDVGNRDPAGLNRLVQETEELLNGIVNCIDDSIEYISDEGEMVSDTKIHEIGNDSAMLATEQEEEEEEEEQEEEEQEQKSEEQTKAAQTQAEQTQAEQTQAAQTQAEQTQAAQIQAAQTQAAQTQAAQTQAEQTQAEQTQAEQTQAAQTQAEQTQAAQTQAEQTQAEQKQPLYTTVLDRAENIRHKLERKQEEINAARIALGTPDEVRKNPQKKERMQVYNEQLQNTTLALATVMSLIIRPLKALFNFVSSFFGKSKEETQSSSIEMSVVRQHQKNSGGEPVSDSSNLQKRLEDLKMAIENQAKHGNELKEKIEKWKIAAKKRMGEVKLENPKKDPKKDSEVVRLVRQIVLFEKMVAKNDENIDLYKSQYKAMEQALHKMQQKENQSISLTKR